MSVPLPTVTAGDWCVSTETSTEYEGATLRVFKLHERPGTVGLFQYGDLHGRRYATREEATADALAHGYLQLHYRRVWCPECRELHTFLGKPRPYIAVMGCIERKMAAKAGAR